MGRPAVARQERELALRHRFLELGGEGLRLRRLGSREKGCCKEDDRPIKRRHRRRRETTTALTRAPRWKSKEETLDHVKRFSFLVGIAALVNGCSHPIPEERVSSYPESYKAERLAGVRFLELFDKVEVLPRGALELTKGERKHKEPFPVGDPRPHLALRLSGPAGTIERDFVVIRDYTGPLLITYQDADEIGILPDSQRRTLRIVTRELLSRHTYGWAQVKAEVGKLETGGSFDAVWTLAETEGSEAPRGLPGLTSPPRR
jgi:hypothetical protein